MRKTVYDCASGIDVKWESGSLLALGNADPCAEDTCHESHTTLFAGEALAVFRADREITITVACDQLPPVSVTI